MDEKVPGDSVVCVPLNVIRVRINYKMLTIPIASVNFYNDFNIYSQSPENLKANLPPPDKKRLLKLIGPSKTCL